MVWCAAPAEVKAIHGFGDPLQDQAADAFSLRVRAAAGQSELPFGVEFSVSRGKSEAASRNLADAEMVLADDNFASIAHAVEEGRTVYDNLKKSIAFILPTGGGEALTILTAIAFGRILPITAAQILWINMITAVTLALALAFEAAERDVMSRPPRKRGEPILSGFLLWRIAFVSTILVAGTFGMFLWQREHGASIEFARTAAVNTLVMFEVFYLFNARFLLASSFNRAGILGSRPVLIAVGLEIVFQLFFTYAPPMQILFQTGAIDAVTWAEIVIIASTVFFLVEVEKFVLRRFANNSGEQGRL